jgi:hypothetical protein
MNKVERYGGSKVVNTSYMKQKNNDLLKKDPNSWYFLLALNWEFGILKTNHRSNTHEKKEDTRSRWFASRIVIINYVTFNFVKLES